ncbi:MAG: hypothetical protein ABI671_07830 [Burkholderiales bacterium]
MFEPRLPPHNDPRRTRGLGATHLCLLFAAVLTMLPWLFAPDAGGAWPEPSNTAKAVSARVISAATNRGATT